MANVLLYVLRRDLRLRDNPIFHHILRSLGTSDQQPTYLLPIYVFSADQIEISGFLSSAAQKSPYPEARSAVAGFWRCGPHRAKFLAESIFDLQESLRLVGSDLIVRVGLVKDVVKSIFKEYNTEGTNFRISQICMTAEEGVEERREERAVEQLAIEYGANFKSFPDEKYFVDDRDVPFDNISDLPDMFTAYRKRVEPLREIPRLPLSVDGNLLPLPSEIPGQFHPFDAPRALDDTISRLLQPLNAKPDICDMSSWPNDAYSAHPFKGGEHAGHSRIAHLLSTGSVSSYKDTRNGMVGLDYSTKLSAWLALGSITARQVHHYLVDFEEGRTELGKGAQGYGKGENKGTGWIRFELLWRDYMRLCCRKFRHHLFRLEGMKRSNDTSWKYPNDEVTRKEVDRFLKGTTGISLIDASMRELWHTGYTSNRTRQNVGSFFARHLAIDWRIGAEWYESLLVDYDLSSNWGNWQAVSITDRIFNPIKQSYDYDPDGIYIRTWLEELRKIERVEELFQPWKLTQDQRCKLGLAGMELVQNPLKRINFKPHSRKLQDAKRSNRAGRRNVPGKGWVDKIDGIAECFEEYP